MDGWREGALDQLRRGVQADRNKISGVLPLNGKSRQSSQRKSERASKKYAFSRTMLISNELLAQNGSCTRFSRTQFPRLGGAGRRQSPRSHIHDTKRQDAEQGDDHEDLSALKGRPRLQREVSKYLRRCVVPSPVGRGGIECSAHLGRLRFYVERRMVEWWPTGSNTSKKAPAL